MRVPSWRTRMFPARTVSPPKIFTPRLWPWLSRPLRELPPAFLCAIANPLQLCLDRRDFQHRLMLTMPPLATITFAPFLFKDDYLFCLRLSDDFAGNLGVGDQRRPNFDLAIAADEQHIRQGYLVAHLAREPFNLDDVPFRDSVLLSTGSNYRVLHGFPDVLCLKENPIKVNKRAVFRSLSGRFVI